MSSQAERELIAALEDQAALINRYLDQLTLDIGRADARGRKTIQREIEFQEKELARVHKQRAAAQRRLAAAEGKRK